MQRPYRQRISAGRRGRAIRPQPHEREPDGSTSEGFTCPVLLPAKVGEDGFFERLICTAWPGSGSFGRVVRKFAAPEVCLVAYPFECQWLYWFSQKQRNGHTVPSVSASEKSALLGLSGEADMARGA